tara:strand:- start:12244 stop:12780 length:537 start_codon:yes stop_codon:yes gene_type:complete
MLTENNEGSTPQESVGQSDQTGSQIDDQATSLLSEEKAYAKKQRQRAQEAERKYNELAAKMEEQKNAQLAEQGKYKEMYEDLKTKATAWENDSNEYRKFVDSEKSNLLESLPEDDRDDFKDLSLTQLKKIVSKVQTKPEKPSVVRGDVGTNIEMNKTFKEMTEAEREKWHQSMLNKKS